MTAYILTAVGGILAALAAVFGFNSWRNKRKAQEFAVRAAWEKHKRTQAEGTLNVERAAREEHDNLIELTDEMRREASRSSVDRFLARMRRYQRGDDN
jgi:hypothetical protein